MNSHSVIHFFLSLLFSCPLSSQTAPALPKVPESIVVTKNSTINALLSRVIVVNTAKRFAKHEGVNLKKIRQRLVMFSPDAREWTVYFDSREMCVGCDFHVSVRDVDSVCSLSGGK